MDEPRSLQLGEEGHVDLLPGERVVWSGQPSAIPPYASIRRIGHPAILLAGLLIAVVGLALIAAIMSMDLWKRGKFEVKHLLGASPLIVMAIHFTLSALARRARRYVVTTRRVFLCDPITTLWFPLRPGSAKQDGATLAWEGVTPVVLCRGRFPWSVAARLGRPAALDRLRASRLDPVQLRRGVEQEAALRDLPDPAAALADIERALGQAGPGEPIAETRFHRAPRGRFAFLLPLSVPLAVGVLIFIAWLQEPRMPKFVSPVPASTKGSANGLVVTVKAAFMGNFTAHELVPFGERVGWQNVSEFGASSHFPSRAPSSSDWLYEGTVTIANVTTSTHVGHVQLKLGGRSGGRDAYQLVVPPGTGYHGFFLASPNVGTDETIPPGEKVSYKFYWLFFQPLESLELDVSDGSNGALVSPGR